MKQKILNFLKFTFIIIICLLLLSSLYQRIFPNSSNSIFGFRTFVIVSESMEPDIKVGDVILVRERDPSKIKMGDVVSYQGMTGDFEGKVITHEVQSIMEEEGRYIFYTKGTNNVLQDPEVLEEQLYGVVVHKFILFSLVSKIIRSTIGFFLLIFIPCIVILVKEIRTIRRHLKERGS